MGVLTDFFDDPFSFLSGGGNPGDSMGEAGMGGFGPAGSPDAAGVAGSDATGIGGGGVLGTLGKAAGGAMLKTAKGGGSSMGFMQPSADSYRRFQPMLGTSAGKQAADTKPAQVADATSIHNMWVNRMRAFSGLYDKSNNG